MSGNHHNHHDSDEVLSKSALQWILGAGAFAAALSALVIGADYFLSHSTHEKELGATLYEMRTAQASMPARVTDPRQVGELTAKGFGGSAVPVTNVK